MNSGYSGGGTTFSCARGRCTRKAAPRSPSPSPPRAPTKTPSPPAPTKTPSPPRAATKPPSSPPRASSAATKPSSPPRATTKPPSPSAVASATPAASAGRGKTKKKPKTPPKQLVKTVSETAKGNVAIANVANNNGFEIVGAKAKITKEQREAKRAENEAEQRRIARESGRRQKLYKESLLSGYASHVGEIRAKERQLELAKLTEAAKARVSSAAAAAAAIEIPEEITPTSKSVEAEEAGAAVSRSSKSSRSAEAAGAAAPSSRSSSRSSKSSKSTASHKSVEAAEPPQVVFIPLAAGVSAQLAHRPLQATNMVMGAAAAAGGGGGPPIVAEPPVAPGPMSKPHLQGFALRIATEINSIVNDPKLIQTFMQKQPAYAASFYDSNIRFSELYRYMVKGSTAETLLHENISLAYAPKAHVGDFPFNINSDVDTTIIINPNLPYYTFELIRVTILYAIVTYAENMVRFLPAENAAITAELAEQGYEYDGNPSTNRIIYERPPDQKSIESPILQQLYDKIMNVSHKNMFNWRIIENLNNLNVTVLRLFTRTKVGGRPKPIDVLDVVVPTRLYSLLPVSWTYSFDYEIFNWPSRHYQFPIFGAFAQFFERTYGLFNFYSDAALARIHNNELKVEMVAKKRRWQRSLQRLRTLARTNPKTRSMFLQLAPYSGIAIDGVTIGSILAEFNKA